MSVDSDAQNANSAQTNFATDSVSKLAIPAKASFQDTELMSVRDSSTIALADIIQTPIAVSDGVMTVGAPLYLGFSSHSQILAVSPYMLDKLRGYLGLRASVTARLVVNADKYTQGRLCLSFLPLLTPQAVYRRDHRHVTQLQHVTLDLNTETEVSLKIPHRGPFTHYDITEARYNTGIFQVSELLPHKGNPYSYTVYMNYSEVDLLGPTTLFTVDYQSSLEIERNVDIPLSTKVMNISKVASSLSNIPLVSSYVSALSWAAAVTSKVLSAFGWSKPLNTKSPDLLFFKDRPGYTTVDGTDVAENLGMSAMNCVKVDKDLGFTGLDEMSIAYLIGINSVLVRSSWGVSSPSGSLVLSFACCPQTLKSNVTGLTTDRDKAQIAHPIAYLSDLFEKYRGSLTFTMDFAKTIFHSGRLLVIFVPTGGSRIYQDQSVAPRIDFTSFETIRESTRNCHKDIVDVRKGNKFTLNFPYMSVSPYQDVTNAYGFVYIYVLNPLVASDSGVSPVVNFSLSVKAGDDFEFAVPAIPRYFPMEQVGNGEGVQLYNNSTLAMVTYESGLETTAAPIIDKCVGTSSKGPISTIFAEYCIGEKILSVKQIAMRSKLFYTPNDTPARFPLNPFYIDVFKDASMRDYQRWNNVTPSPRYTGSIRDSAKIYDYYSYIGAMYTYVRGGVILTLESSAATGTSLGIFNNHFRPSFRHFNEWSTSGRVSAHRTERFYVPAYNNAATRYTFSTPLTDVPTSNSQGDYTSQYGFACKSMSITGEGGLSAAAFVSRCGADDTQFGGFRGIPFMYLRKPYLDVALAVGVPTNDRKLANTTSIFPSS